MSNNPGQRTPTYRCYRVDILVDNPSHLENVAITASFRGEGGGTLHYSMTLEQAWQLEKSFSNPSYDETPPFALRSGDIANIFPTEETSLNFQMTLEQSVDFQEKLLEKLRSFDESCQTMGLRRNERKSDHRDNPLDTRG